MGMFDSLTCQRGLPDGCAEREFQTKSLGCTLEHYCLSAHGRLRLEDGSDTGFHGVLRFHTRTPAGLWHEYEAKFTDGALQHLVPAASAAYSPHGFRLPSPSALP